MTVATRDMLVGAPMSRVTSETKNASVPGGSPTRS